MASLLALLLTACHKPEAPKGQVSERAQALQGIWILNEGTLEIEPITKALPISQVTFRGNQINIEAIQQDKYGSSRTEVSLPYKAHPDKQDLLRLELDNTPLGSEEKEYQYIFVTALSAHSLTLYYISAVGTKYTATFLRAK